MIAGVTFPSHSVAADNLEYLMHDVPQSLVPGYILKSLYVLTLLLSPELSEEIENLISISDKLLKNGEII
jgi:hypothetical protein